MRERDLIEQAERDQEERWREAHTCSARYIDDCQCMTCDCCGKLTECIPDAEGLRFFCEQCCEKLEMTAGGAINEALL